MGTIPTAVTPPGAVAGPSTATAGALIPSAHNNALRDTVNLILNPPKVKAYASAAQSLGTSGVYSLIALDAEEYKTVQSGDTSSHDNVTTNSRLYFRASGLYVVEGGVSFATNATGIRAANVRKNAAGSSSGGTGLINPSQLAASGSSPTAMTFSFTTYFVLGDYIEMFAAQASGASLALTTGPFATYLSIRLVAS